MLASCVAPVAREQAPASRPSPPVVALPAAPVGEDWRDVPLSAGGWSYHDDAAGPIARFGMAGQGASFALRCDRVARSVVISRAAETPAVAPAAIGFVTSFGNFSYAATPPAGQPPAVSATVAAFDPNLDKLAFSRGRFIVTFAGAPRLVIPSWPEAARVIEDCRG